jgi:predicted phosphoadenosine phosphosulfate sulfurtransferase
VVRAKRYIDADVYSEAKDRIRHILDTHDSAAVCFSGGKDSLATLHLVREVYEERGLGPVQVIFRDEEFIPAVVIDFVTSFRSKDWLKLHYFCVPLLSSRFVLGETKDYVQWDENRPHVREKPDFAITLRPEDKGLVLDQFSGDDYFAERLGLRGKVAFINGIRASESLIRLRASVEKLNDNYINASSSKRVSMCKPIYDWEENDVFRYFYEKSIPYCAIYDNQIWAKQILRVATPMVSESAKHLWKLRSLDPILYQQCVSAFPEMDVQARYWSDYRRHHRETEAKNSESIPAIRRWIAENITEPGQLKIAMEEYRGIMGRRKSDPGAYPLKNIFRHFMTGAYKKKLLPEPKSKRKHD